MSDARLRQVREERKRRRRKKRRQERTKRLERGGVLASAVQLVFSPEGVTPDPARLAELRATRMSDALVELMEPYSWWPPAADELDELEFWLQLGVDVWNVVVEAGDVAGCVRGLARLAEELDDDHFPHTEAAVDWLPVVGRRARQGAAPDASDGRQALTAVHRFRGAVGGSHVEDRRRAPGRGEARPLTGRVR